MWTQVPNWCSFVGTFFKNSLSEGLVELVSLAVFVVLKNSCKMSILHQWITIIQRK